MSAMVWQTSPLPHPTLSNQQSNQIYSILLLLLPFSHRPPTPASLSPPHPTPCTSLPLQNLPLTGLHNNSPNPYPPFPSAASPSSPSAPTSSTFLKNTSSTE